MTADEKFRMMTQKPVEPLIWSLAIPTIISMLISSIYNMADTFFVSKISTSASGAVGVAFSLMSIIQAIGFTFGAGSGNYISRLLGQKNKSLASKVAATGFFTSFALSIALSVLGTIYLDRLVYALGATHTIAPFAKDYVRYILIGMPFMVSSLVLNQILRYQGSAYYAAIGIGLGGILNIILDPIFIFKLEMGISGASLATIISQFISFSLLLWNCRIGENIRIKFQNFSPTVKIYKTIFRDGLPSFYRQFLSSAAMIYLNFATGSFGDAAVAAISIVARIYQFLVSAARGFGQGFQPVCGFNYGAKYYDRVLKAFWFCVKEIAILFTLLGMAGFILAPQIIKLFRKEDLELITIGARALQFQCLALPLSAGIITSNMFLQNIGKGTRAALVSISRQGLFFFPTILLLRKQFGLVGIQMSQPFADLFTFIFATIMTISILKEIKSKQFKKDNQLPQIEILD